MKPHFIRLARLRIESGVNVTGLEQFSQTPCRLNPFNALFGAAKRMSTTPTELDAPDPLARAAKAVELYHAATPDNC